MPPVSGAPITPSDALATLAYYRDNPLAFARDILGVHPVEYQRLILESVRDHRRTAVRSCHGVGKTFIAAVVVLWFLACHPNSKVITTAPTWRQVRDLLWTQIRALVTRAERRGYTLGGVATSSRFEFAEDWFATGLSSNIVENFLGYHAPSILFLADETSGVDQEILDAAKGYGTNAHAKELYIGNPTQVSGGFYNAFHTGSELWSCLRINAFDSPNFTEKIVRENFPTVAEYMDRKQIPYYTGPVPPPAVLAAVVEPGYVRDALVDWGEDSALFAVKVLGQFPTGADDTVVALGLVEAARARYADWLPPAAKVDRYADISCDVSRFGSDETVIASIEYNGTLRDSSTHPLFEDAPTPGDDDPGVIRDEQVNLYDRVTIREIVNTGTNTEQRRTHITAGRMLKHARELEAEGIRVRRLVVDDAGVGGGVSDNLVRLRKEGKHAYEIVEFNGGNDARQKDDYPNRRSEAWFNFAKALTRIALDPDKKLMADLVAPTYELDGDGRRVVEQKKHTKKRLKRSPDRADAVLMPYAARGIAKGRKPKRRLYT